MKVEYYEEWYDELVIGTNGENVVILDVYSCNCGQRENTSSVHMDAKTAKKLARKLLKQAEKAIVWDAICADRKQALKGKHEEG